jgi:hypothetical protein
MNVRLLSLTAGLGCLAMAAAAGNGAGERLFVLPIASGSYEGGVLTLSTKSSPGLYSAGRPALSAGPAEPGRKLRSWNSGKDRLMAGGVNAALFLENGARVALSLGVYEARGRGPDLGKLRGE